MTFKEIKNHLQQSPEDAWYYVQGNLRLMAYKSKYFKWLLRKHVIEQFEKRKTVWAKDCYWNGSCMCCGCDTPELFFSDKACSAGKTERCTLAGLKQCYPAMKSRSEWKKFNQQIK